MPSNLPDPAPAPAALSAFLRGIERRGALFAELQCGDQEAGDAALAASMRAFRTHAGAVPMADWPRRFWALLVVNPQLRRAAVTAAWPNELHSLAGLEPSQRQALLLRLAASLPETEAAAVLGVDLAEYEQVLAAACPRDGHGQPDPVGWRALAEMIQQQLRDLPPQRLARLAALREAAIAGSRMEPSVVRAPAVRQNDDGPPSRRRWLWIALVVAVCVAALAATWWWPQLDVAVPATAVDEGVRPLQEQVDIRSEPLAAQEPAARFDAAAAVLLHPDFQLLSDPQDAAVAQEADFLAWIASGVTELPDAVPQDEAAAAPPPATGTETTDAQL